MSTDEDNEFDLKEWSKKFLPAILALVVALTAWINNRLDIEQGVEDRIKTEVEFNSRLTQVELQAAEMRGEQKSQRELLTELRLDIREIKTLLENSVGKSKVKH